MSTETPGADPTVFFVKRYMGRNEVSTRNGFPPATA
jgi:hypothetical protein